MRTQIAKHLEHRFAAGWQPDLADRLRAPNQLPTTTVSAARIAELRSSAPKSAGRPAPKRSGQSTPKGAERPTSGRTGQSTPKGAEPSGKKRAGAGPRGRS
jgi:hypothetical protein